MSTTELFSDHIQRLQSLYEEALNRLDNSDANAVLIHSGSEHYYFCDDRSIAFQAYGHFLHWLPVNKPDQFILVRSGEPVKYFQIVPADFWYDQHIEMNSWWSTHIEIVRLSSKEQLADLLDSTELVYIGEEPKAMSALLGESLVCNPSTLVQFLDYYRAYKSAHEVQQLRLANAAALKGHHATQQAFFAGGTEYEIHQAYLNACEILEDEAPYTNIVALNEKGAVLHYQNKRRTRVGENQVLLVDAGYRVNGYGSDITRTTVAQSTNEVFSALLAGMEKIELELVACVTPGKSYVTIHDLALKKISQLLTELDILKCDAETAVEQKITQLFMPHGTGHLLGIQVHDVAGFQQDDKGTTKKAPDYAPALRNTRMMEKNMVFTIEPGCYFIPMLLEPHRNSDFSSIINWELIDLLYPLGGIRIEDNILVTDQGSENLTRGH